jgi:long-subunit fatty acid transport protein
MTNIKKTLIIALALGMQTGLGLAAGTSSAQFLKMGAGARAAGMGDAFTAIDNDATAAYWNPAGLASMESAQISVSHNSALVDTQYQTINAAIPVAKNVMAASIYRMDHGSIEGYNVDNEKTGSFDAGSLAVGLTLSRKLSDNLLVGVSGKYVSESIESESAATFAGDVGVILKERLFNRFNFGFSMQNLGGKMTFVQEAESLPRTLRAGASTTFLAGKLLMSADIVKPNDRGASLHMGAEYKVNSLLNLRGGYQTVTGQEFDVDGLTNVTGGLGLNLNQLTFDYAFVPFGELGSMHRVSLLFRFANR